MSNKDILNVEDQIEKVMNESNEVDLLFLLNEFKQEQYPNVLSKSKQLRKKYRMEINLCNTLLLIEAISHAQIGELAFMSNYKSAR